MRKRKSGRTHGEFSAASRKNVGRPSEALLDRILGPETPKPHLDNLLGITNRQRLTDVEAAITVLTIQKALRRLSTQSAWGLKQWRLTHQIIFKDVYPWAGSLRTTRISKATDYIEPEDIQRRANKIFSTFRRLHSSERGLIDGLKKLPQDELATSLGTLCNDLNLVHPYREGTGRSLRTFMTGLARQAGFDLEWSRLGKERKSAFDAACIAWLMESKIKGHYEQPDAARNNPANPMVPIFQTIITPLERPVEPVPKLDRVVSTLISTCTAK